MNIDIAEMGMAALRVLALGLVFGAGLPALFAVGMRLQSAGTGEMDGEAPGVRRPALLVSGYAIFTIVVLVALAAVLWITRLSIYHYFGISLFGAGQ
ncbi:MULTISPECIES: hypothetical protein [Microbacterium]|uniref:hypothetical protein n=1 Tax=Microbacterium TaxID=33882 RepID=UPI001E5B9D40|nr:hypothetical protein [Microbacterium nymphoidis]MCD2500092.1 hypothetical protein [Microbacterium nymphoidis]